MMDASPNKDIPKTSSRRMGIKSESRLYVTVATASTTEYPVIIHDPITCVTCKSAITLGRTMLNMDVFISTIHTVMPKGG